jgi:putative two-component system response regulator
MSWPQDARILVVDDEDANIRLLEAILTREGYRQVRCFNAPNELIEAAVAEPPDLVLLDLHMPGIDGIGLLEALQRLLPPDEFVPTIMLTADMSREARERALAAGAKDFLRKPYDLTEVRQRIRNLLETRHLHQRLAAQNALLEERVRERTKDLEGSREELLLRLALAAEYRDDDTHRHTRRVGVNAAALAAALGLPREEQELLLHAAPLHDVGKIGVADRILLKPGPLSPDEMADMRRHSQIGARILAGSASPVLRLAERIALEHHERWDGTGYPHGLAGEAISLPARITSIVDVFDALTHQRPYKPAWPVPRALDELRRLRGQAFDPHVLDVFVEGVEQGAYTDWGDSNDQHNR